MSAAATKDDIDEVLGVLRDFMTQVDDRFNHVDYQLVDVTGRLTKVETEIVDLKQSLNHLTNTIDGFLARIDKYETELAARDSQFERLLVWARKVSEKTGIPLENL